jgi:membrane associated rhomboid family serine protease
MPGVVVAVLAVLAGIHLFRAAFSLELDLEIVWRFAFVPARYGDVSFSLQEIFTDPAAGQYVAVLDHFGGALPGGVAAQIWSPLTYSVLHADWMHLIVNSLWLAAFGAAVARRFGTARFLAFFAVTAIAGAAAHYLVLPEDTVPVVGASAAVSGLMAAAARFAFRDQGVRFVGLGRAHQLPAMSLVEMVTNRTAMSFLVIWFLINLGVGLTSGTTLGAAVAWQAHIGGFLAGLLLFPLFDPVPRRGATPPTGGPSGAWDPRDAA